MIREKFAGKFITLEGPEGAGKSTQLKLLADYLTENGVDFIITREPGGTPLAEKLRNIVKHYNGTEKISDKTELLLIEAARSQHVECVILPALKKHRTVICDRFMDSSTAYQGYGRNLDLQDVAYLNNFAVGEAVPDATVIIDVDTEKSFARFSGRTPDEAGIDRFENEKSAFHGKIRQGFLALAAQFPERIRVVDGSLPITKVHELLIKALHELLR